MLRMNHGHIVTIASLAGHVGISKLVDYCSSKFAAVGFDEALRLELEHLGAEGVLTTCICPFFIQATGMFEDVNARYGIGKIIIILFAQVSHQFLRSYTLTKFIKLNYDMHIT